jgi:hypothetical protein
MYFADTVREKTPDVLPVVSLFEGAAVKWEDYLVHPLSPRFDGEFDNILALMRTTPTHGQGYSFVNPSALQRLEPGGCVVISRPSPPHRTQRFHAHSVGCASHCTKE